MKFLAWAALAACGWEPKPCWLDRLGRAIGASWIGFAAAYEFATFCAPVFGQ